MRHPFTFLFLFTLTAGLVAAAPGPATGATTSEEIFAAAAGEPELFPRLRGVRLLSAPDQLTTPGFPADGLHTALAPLVDRAGAAVALSPFLDHPASQASLERLALTLRTFLRIGGRPFASVYLPPQDVTGGYVQVVVAESRSDGAVTVAGARHFSSASYRVAMRQPANAPIDAARVEADLAWLNRNPYRRAVVAAQAGVQPGTTHLVLRTDERFPLSLNTGYSNTGTRLTDENRVSAGFTWGNALGRGDLLSYGFAADPERQHLRSHSGNYTAFLPWRHVLTLQGAYSEIESAMPAPFAQSGKSWQVGARYEVPLAAPRAGWTQSLHLTADFKYSDNTLEFATVPITNNATHVAQVGASYGLTFPALGGGNDARLELAASPGGLSPSNTDAAFAGSRAGAKAAYAYARLGLRHQHSLGAGLTLTLSADAQFATGALLGTEQLNGGGSSAVRGYRESSAFGDWGVVGSAELHAPGFALVKGRDRVDAFAFADAASLRLRVDDDGTDLASAGLGVNYQFGRWFSLRGSYGWQLQTIASSRGVYSGHGHLSANVSW